MIDWVHPSVFLILGAFLIPFFKGRMQQIYIVALPVLAQLTVMLMTPGIHGVVNFIGFELIFGRVDKLSLAFAYVFSLAALIGAIYLDQGYKKAEEFINRFIIEELSAIIEQKTYRDSKSLFQEEAQDRVGITPTYEVVKEWGPDHARHFDIGVFLGDELIAKGEGLSKQEAQQIAAERALKLKQW